MASLSGRCGARYASLRVERLEDLMLLSFADPVSYPAWYNAVGMDSQDLNGDGYSDIVVANASLFPGEPNGKIGVLLNNGDGTFGDIRLFEVGVTPSQVTIGDFDGDGLFDFAVPNGNRGLVGFRGPGSVTVLFGDGEGWARRYQDITVGWATSSIAQGDFNLDGCMDLVVSNVDSRDPPQPGSVMMLVNDCAGGFAEPVVVHTGEKPDRQGPGWVTVYDFNFDGLADLAISAGRGSVVSILLGLGDGTFGEATHNTVHRSPSTLRTGDFNGDGLIDLVSGHGALLAQGDPHVSVLLGNGDGTFGEFIRHDIGTNPLGVITGDFNLDGLDDIATSNPPPSLGEENRITIYALSNGDGTFTNFDPIDTGPAPVGLVVADFNSDGCLDLAVSHAHPNIQGQPGTVAILLNNCDGAAPGGGAPGVPGDDFGAGLAFLTTLVEQPEFRLTTELPLALLTLTQPEQPSEQAIRDQETVLVSTETPDLDRVNLDLLFGTEWLDRGF